MNQLAIIEPTAALPAIVGRMDERARYRFLEFFTAQIRNPHTRRAYVKAVTEFCAWLDARGLPSIAAVTSIHVAAYVEELGRNHSAPTVKLRLAAIRSCFDWLTSGGVLPFNPAAVRGPKHVVKKGKTPILAPDEARLLLDSIDATSLAGKRDRTLIALMTYSFARISAATGLRVKDVLHIQHRLWLRLHEKGGKEHEMPCHHRLEEYLREWLERSGLRDQPNAFLFPSIARGTGRSEQQTLTDRPLYQGEAYAMIRRRAEAAGIEAKIGNHTFRGTGITAYLKNGGTLERAKEMANHSSPRTTSLYDRRQDEINLDDVQRIAI